MKERFRKYADENRYTVMLLAFIAILLVFFTITKGKTLWTPGAWKGIVVQFPEYGVITLGIMFCFILGKMDMSFVALGDFASILAVQYMGSHLPEDATVGQQAGVIVVGLLIAIAIGVLGGLINGVLVAFLNIPPVMATLAMQMVWLGISTALTQGNTVTGVPTLYAEIGHKMVFGFIPFVLLLFLIVFAICAFLLGHTTYGEKVYMVGANNKAAQFSGINVRRMIVGTYILADVLAVLGCMIMVSTNNSAKADYGTSYVMQVILILVLAGVLPDGGLGKIVNVLLSIVAVQIISSCVNMFQQLNTYYANVIWGGLLLLVLIMGTRLTSGKVRKKTS